MMFFLFIYHLCEVSPKQKTAEKAANPSAKTSKRKRHANPESSDEDDNTEYLPSKRVKKKGKAKTVAKDNDNRDIESEDEVVITKESSGNHKEAIRRSKRVQHGPSSVEASLLLS